MRKLWVSFVVATGGFFAGVPVAGAGVSVSASSFLPWDRWHNGTKELVTNYGLFDLGAAAASDFPPALFWFANMLWELLFMLVGLSGKVVGAAADSNLKGGLNTVAHNFAEAIISGGSSSLGPLLIMWTFGWAAWQMLRTLGSDLRTPLFSLVRPLMGWAILTMLINVTPGDMGSPSWFIDGLSNISVQAAGGAAGAVASVLPAPTTKTECDSYLKELRQGFEAQITQPGPNQSVGAAQFENSHRLVLSGLWEETVLKSWASAQFGDNDAVNGRVWCHLLESHANIPAGDQRTLSEKVPDAQFRREGIEEIDRVFGPAFGHKDSLLEAMYAFAWCNPGNSNHDLGFSEAEEFSKVWKRVNPPTDQSFKDPGKDFTGGGDPGNRTGDEMCAKWFRGTGLRSGDNHNADESPFYFSSGKEIEEATNSNSVNSDAAEGFLLALNGHNVGGAIAAGLVAVLLAVGFGWVLGRPMIAASFSVLGIVLAVLMVPVVAVSMMIPGDGPREFERSWVKMLGGSTLAASLFWLVIGFVTTTMSLSQALVRLLVGGTVGPLIESVLLLAAAVFALQMMRGLFRKAGHGHLLSSRGMAGVAVRGFGGNPFDRGMAAFSRGASGPWRGGPVEQKVADGSAFERQRLDRHNRNRNSILGQFKQEAASAAGGAAGAAAVGAVMAGGPGGIAGWFGATFLGRKASQIGDGHGGVRGDGTPLHPPGVRDTRSPEERLAALSDDQIDRWQPGDVPGERQFLVDENGESFEVTGWRHADIERMRKQMEPSDEEKLAKFYEKRATKNAIRDRQRLCDELGVPYDTRLEGDPEPSDTSVRNGVPGTRERPKPHPTMSINDTVWTAKNGRIEAVGWKPVEQKRNIVSPAVARNRPKPPPPGDATPDSGTQRDNGSGPRGRNKPRNSGTDNDRSNERRQP